MEPFFKKMWGFNEIRDVGRIRKSKRNAILVSSLLSKRLDLAEHLRE